MVERSAILSVTFALIFLCQGLRGQSLVIHSSLGFISFIICWEYNSFERYQFPFCLFILFMGSQGKNTEVVCHCLLNGYESEQALGVGDGQGSLACYSPWGHRESDTID